MTSTNGTTSHLRVGASGTGPQAAVTDSALPDLAQVFDQGWAWHRFCADFGRPEEQPDRLKLDHFDYEAGRYAVVSYIAERRVDGWMLEEPFTFLVRAGKPAWLFRFPDDPYLPGLRQIASSIEAQRILPRYVQLHPKRLNVQTVRYRPTRRAVVRQTVRAGGTQGGQAVLYARAMTPDRAAKLVTAGELASDSGFVLPRLAGYWPEGGVVWLANAPGETVRALIRRDEAPPPERLLDGLEPLWSAPQWESLGRPLELNAAYRWTEEILRTALDDGETTKTLDHLSGVLRPFAESWQPTARAHNDFYDDQVIVTPNGKIALVDFEETGPGDPQLDVANTLGHLRWMARLSGGGEPYALYRSELRTAALERFGWCGRDLDVREALVLFRLASNPVGDLSDGWQRTTSRGLELAVEALDGSD